MLRTPAHSVPTKQLSGGSYGRSIALALLSLLVCGHTPGEEIHFRLPSQSDQIEVGKAIHDLAVRAFRIPAETHGHRSTALLWVALAAGDYARAYDIAHTWRTQQDLTTLSESQAMILPFELYAKAKSAQVEGRDFDRAFQVAFRETFARFSDRSAFVASKWLEPLAPERLRQKLDDALSRLKGKDSIGLSEALDLCRLYSLMQGYAAIAPLTNALIAQENAGRYITDDVLIKTDEGAVINAVVIRPKSSARLPTLLEFTIYVYPDFESSALETASHGYVGVVGFTRGKRRSPDSIVPYEHDGDDARAVIEWISRQPWSDRRVGMYGGSYDGFTQWAAAKRAPQSLKAIMPSVSVAPGIDVPMQGNIFMNFVYPWIPYTTNNKTLDNEVYTDRLRWEKLNRTWYTTGQPYSSLDSIDGTPSPLFHRWLDHPRYDTYWSSMIPYREEFANVNIPVLQTFGYYGDAGQGALYYFIQHHKYNPAANHVLLVGPYDHFGGQHHSADVLEGYAIDPVARLDVHQLRYEWYDFIFRNGPRPALLTDAVNYEVMGANVWRHAPSVEAMANTRMRLFLNSSTEGKTYRLAGRGGHGWIQQNVDFLDRSDADRAAPQGIISDRLDVHNSLVFVSDPLEAPAELSGLFSGQLDVLINKKDLDVSIALFEQLPDGKYFRLSYYIFRASYVRDRSRRQLLTPARPQRLPFRSEILTSRLLQKGSRVVAVIGVLKGPDMQLNYGTGKDVSRESMADAATGLVVRWFEDSYIDLPLRK